MSLAHWNSFFFVIKKTPSNSSAGDHCRPQTSRHICSAASPCWLLSRRGWGGGRCQRWMLNMSSAICLIYLCHWIFMRPDTGVSLQPAVQRKPGVSHSAVITRAPSDVPEILVCVTFFVCFLIRWWFALEANNRFLFQFVCVVRRGGVVLSRSEALWDESAKAPCDKEGGRRAGITPLFCSHAHLLPLTPPGTRSDLCRDLASLFTLTHAFPPLLRGNCTKFLEPYKSFSGRPSRRFGLV